MLQGCCSSITTPPLACPPDVISILHATSICHDSSGASTWSRYMNPPAPVQYTQTQPHHGIKRSAPSDETESSSNISTEFKKLRLNNVRPATVVPARHNHDDGHSPHPNNHIYYHDSRHHGTSLHQSNLPDNNSNQSLDSMTVDETPNRVYITDLDREIAEIEAAESEHNATSETFFLPDVDKNISKIPLNVLRREFDVACNMPPPDRSGNEQALVLYRDPSSISVPEEEDVVRKAIIAARKDAREKMKQDYERQVMADKAASGEIEMDEDHDDDAMDME